MNIQEYPCILLLLLIYYINDQDSINVFHSKVFSAKETIQVSSAHWIFWPPIQPEKYGLKLKVVF